MAISVPRYFALGVREVWLVSIDDLSVEVCRGRGTGEVVRDVIEWRVEAADVTASIVLAEVFAGIEA